MSASPAKVHDNIEDGPARTSDELRFFVRGLLIVHASNSALGVAEADIELHHVCIQPVLLEFVRQNPRAKNPRWSSIRLRRTRKAFLSLVSMNSIGLQPYPFVDCTLRLSNVRRPSTKTTAGLRILVGQESHGTPAMGSRR